MLQLFLKILIFFLVENVQVKNIETMIFYTLADSLSKFKKRFGIVGEYLLSYLKYFRVTNF